MAVSDWDRRELCPDGSCTGLIGPEGTCKVCGRAAPNWGDERRRGTIDADDDDDAAAADDDDANDAAHAGDDDDDTRDPIAPSAPATIGEWSGRQLCVDGACTGLVGPDGTCKVCGKPGQPGAASDDASDDEYDDDDNDGGDDDDDDDGDGDDAALEAAADELAGIKPLGVIEVDDDPNRALCPDGACIGVIGPDGKCKVCGKEAA